MLWMQCAFVQNWILCAVLCIGRTFPCVEPAVGDVIVIKYDYHVKLHSQSGLKKIMSDLKKKSDFFYFF